MDVAVACRWWRCRQPRRAGGGGGALGGGMGDEEGEEGGREMWACRLKVNERRERNRNMRERDSHLQIYLHAQLCRRRRHHSRIIRRHHLRPQAPHRAGGLFGGRGRRGGAGGAMVFLFRWFYLAWGWDFDFFSEMGRGKGRRTAELRGLEVVEDLLGVLGGIIVLFH